MTRQRKQQIAHRAKGLCTKCPERAVTATHCQYHRELHNEWNKAYKLREKEGVYDEASE